jgi:branched-chain amino acid transport system substrate-binding protein
MYDRTMRRCTSRLLAGTSAVALVGMLAACASSGGSSSGNAGGGSNGSSAGTYLIIDPNDFSAGDAPTSVPYLDGLETFIDWKNASGGIGGWKLAVKSLDDGSDPSRGVLNVKTLLADKPVAALAHSSGVVSLAMEPYYKAAQVPQLSYTPVVQELNDPYYFGVGMSSTDSLAIEAQWIKQQAAKAGVAHPRVAMVTVDTPTQTIARNDTRKLMTSEGMDVLKDVTYPLDATSFSQIAVSLKGENPQYILGGILDSAVPAVVNGLTQLGVTVPFINASFGSAEADFQATKVSNYYAVRDAVSATVPPTTSQMTEMVNAAKKYSMTSNMTNVNFTKGWIAGQIIAEGLSTCGSGCTGAKLATQLDKISGLVTGLSQPVTYTSTDHLGLRSASVYQWDPAKSASVATEAVSVPAGYSPNYG